jgi:ribonuclease HI
MCRDNGKPTQIAGCGVVVVFTDDHNRTQFRTYKYGLGNSTQNLADLQAVRLALASVRPAFRGGEAILHVNSSYVLRVMEREGKAFIVNPKKNVREVTEVRKWYGFYNDISVVMENPNDDNMMQAKDLAEMGLATQEHSDSGTLEGFDTVD